MNTNPHQAILQPIPPWDYQTDAILGSHMGNTDYLLAPGKLLNLNLPEASFNSNEEAWQAILSGWVTEGREVVLNQFQVSDWFPRAPGLFYTHEAMDARHEAFSYIDPNFKLAPVNEESKEKKRRTRDYTLVFTPEGKLSMLQGGIGAVRLKPVRISDEPFWLMTASSDGITHAGVPLAVPRRICTSLLPYIHQFGAVCATVRGEIEFVPDPFTRLFNRSVRVPKVLLKVREVTSVMRPEKRLENSVAVSFVSDFQGPVRIYSTYVTFSPGVAGSFDRAMSWMKEEYVEGAYKGKIITDFDQVQTVFPEANLALSKVMNRAVSQGEMREAVGLMHASANVDEYFDLVDRQNILLNERKSDRDLVFISYAHAPEERNPWVERILVHLRGLTWSENIKVFSDRDIEIGDKWKDEIEKAIRKTKIAIIVLTADFLGSKFIREAELPPLLEAADADNAKIMCLYGSDVHLSGIAGRLSRYQFVNDPKQPLLSLTPDKQEAVFAKLTRAVAREFETGS